jgi:hypothetical protein
VEWFGVLCTYLEAAVVCVGAGKMVIGKFGTNEFFFFDDDIVGFTPP